MSLTIISTLFWCCISAIIASGAAWRIQGATITEMELSNAQQRIELQRAARVQTERQMQTLNEAQAAAQARVGVIAAEHISAVSALGKLRQSSEAAVRAAGASTDACVNAVKSYAVISNECSERLVSVAGDADRLASDRQTLISAWPK